MLFMNFECPCCGEIALIPIRCAGHKAHRLLYCVECDMVWLSLAMERGYSMTLNRYTCPYEDGKVIADEKYFLTREELKRIGWTQYILDEV